MRIGVDNNVANLMAIRSRIRRAEKLSLAAGRWSISKAKTCRVTARRFPLALYEAYDDRSPISKDGSGVSIENLAKEVASRREGHLCGLVIPQAPGRQHGTDAKRPTTPP